MTLTWLWGSHLMDEEALLREEGLSRYAQTHQFWYFTIWLWLIISTCLFVFMHSLWSSQTFHLIKCCISVFSLGFSVLSSNMEIIYWFSGFGKWSSVGLILGKVRRQCKPCQNLQYLCLDWSQHWIPANMLQEQGHILGGSLQSLVDNRPTGMTIQRNIQPCNTLTLQESREEWQVKPYMWVTWRDRTTSRFTTNQGNGGAALGHQQLCVLYTGCHLSLMSTHRVDKYELHITLKQKLVVNMSSMLPWSRS